ncbi:oxygen-independent coproporphyrinogen III oxidase [Robiginitalea sp. M366]|uniref:oxygen-independent coproporphyrinogen III oxidase n=1 Tax=Robiginitalea aestuariiviva TaxID=3036903 RepID=UPI00240DEDE5|nr:oxygen-independent coproporphyrinogen III oxidase [Robiginitalea aestuariiviva]MDG1571125.1 oxygen-independent coproporphyrinogen III oxidase [Robiginitalea aestuariiviva]
MCGLVQKYNVPGPRYTSYPTVPYWDPNGFSGQHWKETVKRAFQESNQTQGISLYLHLPFCESMCTFCGCHKRITRQHSVEVPYIKALLKEWDLYCQLFDNRPMIRELHLGGGTPTFFSPENLGMLLRGLFRKADRAETWEFSFEGHPGNTTREHLQVLYDAGFRRVSYGVQDYSESVQRAIHRIQSFEQVAEITRISREIGFTSVGHDIIYGLPLQTADHMSETLRKTAEIRPDRIAFYSYAHVPWRKGNGQRGYKESDLPSPAEKLQQYELGKQALKKAGYAEIGMDHFALPSDGLYRAMKAGQLHRNFMGYTESNTRLMIGLGVSSIGDSWYAFAQNVKSIEEYEHLVSCGIIPLMRGHALSEQDQQVRRHILDLMCRFETAWDKELPEAIRAEIEARLREPESDGLVVLGPDRLSVTEKGRMFIRNICMAFDLRLHNKAPETRLFSMTV